MKSRAAAWAVLRVNLTVLTGVFAALAMVLLMLSTAKAQTPHTDQQREAYVDVGVTTVWVEPRTDRWTGGLRSFQCQVVATEHDSEAETMAGR